MTFLAEKIRLTVNVHMIEITTGFSTRLDFVACVERRYWPADNRFEEPDLLVKWVVKDSPNEKEDRRDGIQRGKAWSDPRSSIILFT